MNKIIIENDSIILEELDSKIELKKSNNLIPTFKIIFKESTELEINFSGSEVNS